MVWGVERVRVVVITPYSPVAEVVVVSEVEEEETTAEAHDGIVVACKGLAMVEGQSRQFSKRYEK